MLQNVIIPLASLAGASNQASSNDQGHTNNEPAQRVYRWRKRDTIACDHLFLKEFSEPPLQYFSKFITMSLLNIDVEQTYIYSFKTIHKSIDTTRAEIIYLIGMSIKMEILQLPSYKSYWSQELCCPRIADVMPCNRYQKPRRYLYFVNNDSINAQNKLAKIHPLISMVQDEFVKVEPEEYNSVVE